MFSNFFPKSCRLWDSEGKCGTARQATHGNIILRRKFAHCMPGNYGKYTDTRSEFVELLISLFINSV